MKLTEISFDANEALDAANKSLAGLKIVLPEELSEEVWEKLLVIKELSYPLPLVVVYSDRWMSENLEDILTRLANANIAGVLLKNQIDTTFLQQVNKVNNLGLSIILE